jgi:hypothetical protein
MSYPRVLLLPLPLVDFFEIKQVHFWQCFKVITQGEQLFS